MRNSLPVILLVIFNSFSAFAQDPASLMFNKDAANVDLLQELIFNKVNDYRNGKKLASLVNDKNLWEAAHIHAEYIQKKGELTHFENKRKLKTPFDRVLSIDNSFTSVAENIAYVSTSTVLRQGKEQKREYKTYVQMTDEFVDNWLKSKPHLENIKDKSYNFTGVALLYDQETERVYAVQVFGGK